MGGNPPIPKMVERGEVSAQDAANMMDPRELAKKLPPDAKKELLRDLGVKLDDVELRNGVGLMKPGQARQAKEIEPDEVVEKSGKVQSLDTTSDVTKKSAPIVDADAAAEETRATLDSDPKNSGALVDSARELSSSVDDLTPGQTAAVSEAAAGVAPEEMLPRMSASQAAKDKVADGVRDGVQTISDSADAANPIGVEDGALMVEEAIQAGFKTVDEARAAMSRQGIPLSQQGQALSSVNMILDSEDSALRRTELTGGELLGMAGSAARKMSLIEGQDVSAADVLSNAKDAFTSGEAEKAVNANRWTDYLLNDMMFHRKVRKNPDVMAWLESMFSNEEMREGVKAA